VVSPAGDEPDRERTKSELVAASADAARGLLERRGKEGVEHTLGLIVRGAMAAVPDVAAAGVCLVERDGSVRAYVPTSPAVDELDGLQNELGEGPCLDAIGTEALVEVDDFGIDQRWPRVAAAARERSIGSLLSFPLVAEHGSAGALNLYAAKPHAFGPDAHHLGGLVAAQAAVALGGAQRVAGVTFALESRDVIGQAKGILMERFDMNATEAFALLVSSSQDTNIKLVEVARWLADERGSTEQSGVASDPPGTGRRDRSG